MIRWLVVGAGQAGRCHIAAIERTPDAALAAVVDPANPNIESVPVFTDLGSAIENVQADAIVIATPNDTQVSLAEQALRAGLPVLCEKPVGLNASDAKRLNDTSEAIGVPVGVVLNQRGHAHCRWIKVQIDCGALRPSAIQFTGDLERLKGWHADPARSGGGVLRTIGIHYIDLAMWWLGSFKDTSVTLMGMPNEEAISITAAAGQGCHVDMTLSATRDKAVGPVACAIEADDARVELSGHAITGVQGLPDPPPAEPWVPDLAYGPGHLTVISEATRSLEEGRAFSLPLADALPLLETVQAMYEVAD